MNDRFEQLVQQKPLIWNFYTAGEAQRAEVQEFVQLIVQHCVDIAYREGDDIDYVIYYLKSYFGVE